MWVSYFDQIQSKYSMRASKKKPLIIKLDGKNITKNMNISLLSMNENDFSGCLRKSVKFFTEKYKCLSVFGGDEASFILENPMILLDNLDDEKNDSTHEIIAMFSQQFFDYFNNIYEKEEKVFWHGSCFSINKDKINSYIKFRSGIIKNVMTAYFLKRMQIKDAGRIKIDERLEISKELNGYERIKELQKANLYYNGDKIDIEEYLNGNIKKVEEEIEDRTEDEYFDITKWDI